MSWGSLRWGHVAIMWLFAAAVIGIIFVQATTPGEGAVEKFPSHIFNGGGVGYEGEYGFLCPNTFFTEDEYIASLARWTTAYLQVHPDADADELMTVRAELFEKAGCELSRFGATSGGDSDLPSIGMSQEYKEYAKTFKTHKSEWGFSFKYSPHLEVRYDPETRWTLIAPIDQPDSERLTAIVISLGDNDKRMTAEEWLLGPDSGFNKEVRGYYKTKIDGEPAVYTDGGMWVVVNTPDQKTRLSIALAPDSMPLFTEMGTLVETLTFVR